MKQESELLWEAYVKSKNEDTCECDLVQEKSKPDFLDTDGDGDKKEPIKKALKDKQHSKTDDDEDEDQVETKNEDVGVHHDKFGFGLVVSENINDTGSTGWYDIQFEHGREIVNAVDVKII